MHIVSLSSKLHDDRSVSITITLGGVDGAPRVAEAIEALSSVLAGDLVTGTMSFLGTAGKIYAAIKSARH